MASRKSVVYQPLRPDRDLTILVPARAGSQRIPGKNTKLLGGKPLIQWTLDAATAANPASIIVSTDDDLAARIAHAHGCRLHPRKPAHATHDAQDILWVRDVLPMVQTPVVAICRPTSPFRTGGTIRRAFAVLMHSGAHSVRAVEPVREHPGKMWQVDGDRIWPVLHGWIDGTPWHSCPTQALPEMLKQNASLEMAHVWAIQETGTISGTSIAPFYTDAIEGLDLNTPEDWAVAQERLVKTT